MCAWCVYVCVCDFCLYVQRSLCAYTHLSRTKVCCICVIYSFTCTVYIFCTLSYNSLGLMFVVYHTTRNKVYLILSYLRFSSTNIPCLLTTKDQIPKKCFFLKQKNTFGARFCPMNLVFSRDKNLPHTSVSRFLLHCKPHGEFIR